MQKDIAAEYNSFGTSKGNIVWCGAMNLAWNQLAHSQGLKELHLKTKKKRIMEIIRNYNSTKFGEKDIDEKSTYIKSGYGAKTLEIINKELKDKFPKCSFPKLKLKLHPTDIISFAYLFKQLNFDRKFSPRKTYNFLFNGKPVRSFYADEEHQKKQIIMCYYKDRQNFLINIGDRLTSDVIYLLKSQKDLTIDEVVQEVMTAKKKGCKPINKLDLFEMPVIQIDCSRSVEELINLEFADEPLKGYRIALMSEAIKLKIDESGAKVEARAIIYGSKCAVSRTKPDPPKEFILDKSFWLVMKETNKHPYVCIHINDPIDLGDENK